ncbi:hypothetical protein SDC9_153920 [bioreactor metagenome]|uniref:Uncharacterized protein n=1 Tax=bioreactor metagenome TaxID=1076179 RepID=A0A645F223_9ZZZZ
MDCTARTDFFAGMAVLAFHLGRRLLRRILRLRQLRQNHADRVPGSVSGNIGQAVLEHGADAVSREQFPNRQIRPFGAYPLRFQFFDHLARRMISRVAGGIVAGDRNVIRIGMI